jgi:hypothetical protein
VGNGKLVGRLPQPPKKPPVGELPLPVEVPVPEPELLPPPFLIHADPEEDPEVLPVVPVVPDVPLEVDVEDAKGFGSLPPLACAMLKLKVP